MESAPAPAPAPAHPPASAWGKTMSRMFANANKKAPKKQPVGKPPKGKLWDAEKGQWVPDPNAEETPALYKKPPHRPRENTEWDGTKGHYVYKSGPMAGEYFHHASNAVKRTAEEALAAATDPNAEETPALYKKPPHRPRENTEWDGTKGHYVYKSGPMAGEYFHHASNAVKRTAEEALAAATDSSEAPSEPARKTKQPRAQRRMYQESWKVRLPWLDCVRGASAVLDAQPDRAVAETQLAQGQFRCPSGDKDCPGCCQCSRLFCMLCQERGKKNGFTGDGSRSFHSNSIDQHALHHHKTDTDPTQSSIIQQFEKMLENETTRLEGIFKNVLWLAKEKTPLWKIKSICGHMELQGLPLGKKYINHVMARDMLLSLAYVIREDINQAARKSPVLGLMADESTTVSTESGMILYLRLLKDGIFQTVFWGLVQLHEATADALLDTILDYFQSNNVPTKLLASLATDGASVMLGRHGGVGVLLREAVNVYLLIAHCVAHREALAASAAATGNAICEYFESALHDILNYHSHSTQRKAHLYKLQARLQVQKLRMVRMVPTRWLSRGAATARIYTIIAALILEFKEDSESSRPNAAAAALYALIFSFKFLCCLCLFNDILSTLNQLNESFQKKHVVYRQVQDNVRAVKEYLSHAFKSGAELVGGSSYKAFVQQRVDADDQGETMTWNSVTDITPDEEEEALVRDGVAQFAQALVGALDERFPADDQPVMGALDIMNINTMPTTQREWDFFLHS